MRWLLRTIFLLTAGIALFTACSVTSENMWDPAPTITVPDIVVLGYPNGTGIYDFGPVDVYTTDKATFAIQNTDRGRLLIHGISFQEDEADWFTIDTSVLSSSVSPGKLTTFTIRFKPTDSTGSEATVVILSNCIEKNPYTFTVKGSGAGLPVSTPDINVKLGTTDIPVSGLVTFGEVETGNSSSKEFTIENRDTGELEIHDISISPGGGTAVGEFSIISPSILMSLAQDESTGFTVVFSPQGVGIKSATVSITSDDPDENPYTFAVQGNGTAVPEPDISVKQGENELPDGSGSFHFGFVQCKSTSDPATFTVENTGSATLNITSVTLTGDFSTQFPVDTSGFVFSLAPGSDTVFSIQFAPDPTEEYKWATVTIENDDPDEDPYTFTVEGEGVVATVPDIDVQEIAHNSEYDFGPVLLGDSKTETFTIANPGTADLDITSIVNKNQDKFTLDASMTLLLVPDGSTTTFDITFTPIDKKDKSATIEIYSNDPDENLYKFKVTAHGTDGTEPDINIKHQAVQYPDGSQFYFPDTEEDEKSDHVIFSVENNGTGDLLIESVLFVSKHIGDFGIDYDPEQLTIPPGSSIPLALWFEPTKTGERKTKLQIKSNDPDEDKFEIELIGMGIKD